ILQQNPAEQMILRAPLSNKARENLRRMALASQEIGQGSRPAALPIRCQPGTAPLPPPISKKGREAIKRMVLQDLHDAGREPYAFVIQANLAESLLCSLPGCSFILTGIDAELEGPNCVVKTPDVYWDTGAHSVFISKDLITSEFASYLEQP